MKTSIIVSLVSVLSASQAFAMKCESVPGKADCDYRVYLAREAVDVYASNCEYSDDNGSQSFKIASTQKAGSTTVYSDRNQDQSLTVTKNGKGSVLVLGKGASPIELNCVE